MAVGVEVEIALLNADFVGAAGVHRRQIPVGQPTGFPGVEHFGVGHAHAGVAVFAAHGVFQSVGFGNGQRPVEVLLIEGAWLHDGRRVVEGLGHVDGLPEVVACHGEVALAHGSRQVAVAQYLHVGESGALGLVHLQPRLAARYLITFVGYHADFGHTPVLHRSGECHLVACLAHLEPWQGFVGLVVDRAGDSCQQNEQAGKDHGQNCFAHR